MADLEKKGFLYSPHTSAARIPTEQGLQFFVHGLLEVGDITDKERSKFDALAKSMNKDLDQVLENATTTLSGITKCAGLVMAPKTESALKQVEFVSLSPGRAIVIMVTENGEVENRVIEVPHNISASTLIEAGNYLTHRLAGRTLSEARKFTLGQMAADKAQLDELASQFIEQGIAVWSGPSEKSQNLIIKGRANLIDSLEEQHDFKKLSHLFQALEEKEHLKQLLDAAIDAQGIQIFIGSENKLFKDSGCSMIISPYKDDAGTVMGALGVIGPAQLNYRRVIPMVDYTAKLIGQLIDTD